LYKRYLCSIIEQRFSVALVFSYCFIGIIPPTDVINATSAIFYTPLLSTIYATTNSEIIVKTASKPNGFCVGLGEGIAVGVSKGEIIGVSSAGGVGVSYGVPGSGGVGVGNDGVGDGVRGDGEGTRDGVGVGGGVGDGVTSVGDDVASGSRSIIVVLFLTI